MTIDTQTLGRPVDGNAARVVSKGFSHQWRNEGSTPTKNKWTAPPELRSVPKDHEDMTGRRMGRLTVKGLIKTARKGMRWLVRCDCGNYEERRTRAIKNPNNKNDCCHSCRTLVIRRNHAKAREFHNKHGIWPHESNGVEAMRITREFENET